MNALGNLLWLLFGGLFSAIGYLFCGLAFCFTIIGIPFGLQCFKIAGFVLWPFGRQVVTHARASGCLYTIFNILWIFLWWALYGIYPYRVWTVALYHHYRYTVW